jgi:hypothetical protein
MPYMSLKHIRKNLVLIINNRVLLRIGLSPDVRVHHAVARLRLPKPANEVVKETPMNVMNSEMIMSGWL